MNQKHLNGAADPLEKELYVMHVDFNGQSLSKINIILHHKRKSENVEIEKNQLNKNKKK